MSEEELREKISDIVYISRWVGKENKYDALAAVLTPEEYIEIEGKLVSLFNELNPNKEDEK